MINLARIYNVSDKEVNNLDSAFQLIIKSIDNPREFIRFLNSTCYIAFSPDINLNRNDLLLIEYISFKQPDLFQLIKENPKLFVSENSGLDISDVFNPKQLISKIYDLYSNVLKDKYSSWLPILEVLFPFVKQCQIGNGHLRVNNNSNEGRMNNRIYDGYNFDLYFSLRKDFVVGKNKKLKVIVDKLKEKTNRKQIENLEKEIFEDSKAKVSESIHLFSMYENEFNSKTGLALCKVILDNMEKVPEDVEAVGLSPRNIAASICISLLRDTPKEKISKLLEKYHNNYELIDVFDDLHTFSKDIKKIHKVAYSIWRRMCIDAIKDSINLYNDKYYKPRLIRKLYRGIEGDKKEIIATYLKAIAKKDNIYRIFYDFISVSGNDNGIGYIFKQKDYELLESAQLKNSLPIPMNISQKVIYDIYSKGSRKGYDYRYKDIEINIEEL